MFILNLLFTANLDKNEHITISFNSFVYVLGLILVGVVLYIGTEALDKYLFSDLENYKRKRLRRILFIIFAIIYAVFCISWVIAVRPYIIGDQGHVCDLAQTFFNGNLEEYFPKMSYAGVSMSRYMEAYHQQIPLAVIYSIFFRIMNSPIREAIRGINVIGIALIVFCLYKITQELSKKYEINKTRLFFLIFTFISLPMLETFVYGDIPSLAMCLLCVYFMMKYTRDKNIKYAIFGAISSMFAYMLRMNSLIYIIATVIYLSLKLLEEIKELSWKANLIKLGIIIGYIIITILPATLIKNYYLTKYNMDKSNAYPNVSYFLMAMEKGPRANRLV